MVTHPAGAFTEYVEFVGKIASIDRGWLLITTGDNIWLSTKWEK